MLGAAPEGSSCLPALAHTGLFEQSGLATSAWALLWSLFVKTVYVSALSSFRRGGGGGGSPRWSECRSTSHGIMELFCLEKPSKTVESNHSPYMVKATFKPCPQVPCSHVFLYASRDSTTTLGSLGNLFHDGIFPLSNQNLP